MWNYQKFSFLLLSITCFVSCARSVELQRYCRLEGWWHEMLDIVIEIKKYLKSLEMMIINIENKNLYDLQQL